MLAKGCAKGKNGKGFGAPPPGWGAPKPVAGKGASIYQQARAAPLRPAARPQLSTDQLQERLHSLVYDAVAQAVAPVAHLERSWNEAEIVKKISKFTYKAVGDTSIYKLPWNKMVEEMVTKMMHGYATACGDNDWFFSVDLPPVFFECALMIIENNGEQVDHDTLHEAILIEYEDKLDRVLLDKAMWEVSQAICGGVVDDKGVTKIFHALGKTYWPVLDEVLRSSLMQEARGTLTEEQELRRVEIFIKKWIDESMCRAWAAIPDAETKLTPELAETLFRTLVAPFGVEDPFSCIPQLLTEVIGRPPNDWEYITEAVEQVFSKWGIGGSAAKRRKIAAAEFVPVQRVVPARAAVAAKAPKAPVVAGGKAKFRGFGEQPEDQDADMSDEPAGEGNSRCTSADDCVGCEGDGLVQHVLDGKPADIYCQPCWDSFVRRNPQLEGVAVD